MDAALLGEAPPPFCLRRFLVAAGAGDVGGLGAEAVYGPGQLDFATFEEVYMVQSRILAMQSDETRENAQQDRAVRRAMRLEEQGMLDQFGYNPLETGDLPFDPGG